MTESGTTTIEIGTFEVDVKWVKTYHVDPGVHTYSNGDPGHPPTSELIDVDFDIIDIFDKNGTGCHESELAKFHYNYHELITDELYE